MSKKKMVTTHNYKYYNPFHTMMKTEQLTSNELYRLVGEAYSAYYLNKGWGKMMAKRYLNPFGEFNWMTRSIPRFIKTVGKNAVDMFLSMGMNKSLISDEMKDLMERAKAGKPLIISKIPIKSDEKELILNLKKLKKPIEIS